MAGEFVTWEQIQPIIYLIICITGLIIFFRVRYTHIRDHQKKVAREIKQEKSLDNVIDRKIAAMPKQLEQVNKELDHLKKTGATKEQMKSLQDKKRMLELGVDYGAVAAEIGKPIIKSLTGMIKGMAGGI